MWSLAFIESSRTKPENVPDGVLVPDFVIAFTIMPAVRPLVASNRLVVSSNSAIESRLKRGWFCWQHSVKVTCWPSTLIWK